MRGRIEGEWVELSDLPPEDYEMDGEVKDINIRNLRRLSWSELAWLRDGVENSPVFTELVKAEIRARKDRRKKWWER